MKAEALNSLKLPVTVKAGFVGTITLKVGILVGWYLFFNALPLKILIIRPNGILNS